MTSRGARRVDLPLPPRGGRRPLLALLFILLLRVGASGQDGVFEDLSFREALDRAAREDRVVVVELMSKHLRDSPLGGRDAWADEGVRDWIAKHAIALRVEIEDETALARDLGFETLPTLVMLRSGGRDATEVARATGAWEPALLLDWLRGAEAGESTVQVLRDALEGEQPAPGKPPAPFEPSAEARLAMALLDEGDDAGATEALLSLWKAGHLMDFEYFRIGADAFPVDLLTDHMARLADRYPRPARPSPGPSPSATPRC